MVKLDNRRAYFLMLDTEATNIFQMEGSGIDASSALVYDIGLAVIDKTGKVYETFSYIIKEVFQDMPVVMDTAYYANKLPLYYKDLEDNTSKMVSLSVARHKIAELVKTYKVKAIIAHNMPFDYKALNSTQRYITKSKGRYFLPYGIELWDTMRMAESTICKQKMYKVFCEQNGYLTKNGRVRKTAEVIYQYITNNTDFVESHTGLADVLIEKEIFTRCVRQKKAMKKLAFNPK